MTRFKKGSQWRKWDLHIHTPGTNKNDQFQGETIEEKWNKFIKDINDSPIDISVIGITDYFSIENYFIFKNKIATGKITKKIDLLVPNIELRITPVTGKNKAINIHCLFNPDIDNQIEDRFLSKLNFNYSNSDYSATKSEIIRLGRTLVNDDSFDEKGAYKKGLAQYVISFKSLIELFKNDKKLREETIIVVANNQDGVSGLRKHADFFDDNTKSSALDATVQSVYQFCDAIFSSNTGDRAFFSGQKTSEQEILQKFNSLMPCYHGCDAHDNSKIFKPDGDKYCWIKSDPTFNGLKQTLYEPNERVVINPTTPKRKLGYQVVDKIIIGNDDIHNEEIDLNDGLNCIIGGRSTGKSVLLSIIAKRLKNNVSVKNDNKEYDNFVQPIADSLKIIWEDGIEDYDREIEFFNQGYMNAYSGRNNEKFDKLVKDILEDRENGNLFEVYDAFVRNTKEEIYGFVTNLFSLLERMSSKKQEIPHIGDREGIRKEIEKLKEEIKKIKEKKTFSKPDYDAFNQKKEDLVTQQRKIKISSDDKEAITIINIEYNIKSSLFVENASEETKKRISDLYLSLRKEFIDKWTIEIGNIEASLEETIKSSNDIIKGVEEDNEYLKGLEILENNKRLQQLERQLAEEIKKDNQIQTLQAEIASLSKEVETTKNTITELHKTFYSKAKEISDKLSTSLKDLKIKAYPKFKENEYNKKLNSSINLQSLERQELARYEFNGNESYEVEFKNKFEKLLANEIVLKNSFTSKYLIETLLPNSFYRISYEVTYENDQYSKMSEGKQAFVVLKLLLDFSNKKCPILIDQPEDDLDNRAIYNDLVRYLKSKKKDRQIIVVTHNPNIVVGTDAELIIVANQHGVNNQNVGDKKFQYCAGSIEHTAVLDKTNPLILERQGVKEHICEILEGGETAFKLREKRYDIKI